VDWSALIWKFAEAFLLRCFDQLSTEIPQEYLRAHYDPISRTMDPGLVRDSMPATMRAIRKARNSAKPKDRRSLPRYSREEVRAMTEANLIKAMDTPAGRVEDVRAFAAALGEDDE
jgi:hypothetical protein